MTARGQSFDRFVSELLGVDVRLEDGKAAAEAVLDERFVGPPTFVHGGVISAIFDEVLGVAARHHEAAAMTAHLEVEFRRPWPIGELGRISGQARRLGERKLLVTGELVDADGELLAEARGLWVVPRR